MAVTCKLCNKRGRLLQLLQSLLPVLSSMERFDLLKTECQVLKIKDELDSLSESGPIQDIDLNFLSKKLDQLKNKLASEMRPQRPPLPHLD